MSHVNILLKFQLPSSYCLGDKCFEDWEEKEHVPPQLKNYDGVCRTTLATSGLLKKGKSVKFKYSEHFKIFKLTIVYQGKCSFLPFIP